jgi:lipoprotein-releasing system permease protein
MLEVAGTVIKGVSPDYDWSFFGDNMVEGRIPNYSYDSLSPEILVSSKIASTLGFNLGDTVGAFFVRNKPVKRLFNIVGIYSSGMDEFDSKIVIGDLQYVQRLNDWGIHASIEIPDTLDEYGNLLVIANVTGGNGNYRYDWGQGFEAAQGFRICPQRDTTIRLIASDYWSKISADINETTIPDTAYLKIEVNGNGNSDCEIQLNELDEVDKYYLNETGSKFRISSASNTFDFELIPGVGSSKNYVGGFEVMVNSWDDLNPTLEMVKSHVDFIPNEHGEVLKTTSIMDNESDIFVWLSFLDINVWIILSLMILIGIINMGSALLVLILIRSNFIGLLKSMGATNWYIRKIFLIQAGFLITRGMVWGNIIGVALCLIQQYTGLFSLNAEVYYLSQVPIELNWFHWLLLNIGTLVVCLSALIIPSLVIARIQPARTIKFN